jgi:hypothetical protein
MKKLIILAIIMVAGTIANAASFNWAAANIYGPDGTTKWGGEVNLYAVIGGQDTLVNTYTAVGGVVAKANTTFSNDNLVGGTDYDFYFTITDSGKTFTSDKKNVGALATQTATIQFGNMQSATQNASNWQSVPEPTSGVLLLLGMAGLALKRKRA